MSNNGKMNWAGLLGYTVQPADMELFQTYMNTLTKGLAAGMRTKGILYGGRVTTVSGMQLKVSEGLALMPDGQLVSFPETTFTIPTASSSNPRIDRVELSYSVVNNTSVLDVNANSKVLDVLFVPSVDVATGTPASSPVAPSASSTKLSLAFVSVGIGQSSILSGDIVQDEDSSFSTSAIHLGNKSSYIRMNQFNGALQYSNDGAQWAPFGSGGGGGGAGASWVAGDGVAPVEAFENGDKVLVFEKGQSQSVSLFVKVPSSYLAGSPVSLKLGHYSPGNTNNFKFSAVATLVRKNIDAITSTTNQFTSTNGDVTNSLANKYIEEIYNLSSGVGIIGSSGLNPGDLILIQLTRITPSGTEDVNDVRMIPSSTEVLFS